ncbi:class I SAM-dependent methyltransferase [Caulobacter sp. RL271]|uniref:Class I SAM-dependent methyltransferase n=1 Tax=Caulobacter segnis TaxID=88688 RepID=A0ABY4ZZQ4_9CAUL|nr:class I SAM-dependent methyltransferase [Caulobacter segnis]USQ98150.1 class I SAM-dependent methyltransferase [Caulobacter segnis]
MDERRTRTAFALDAVGQRARAAVKAAWWTATGSLARSLTQPTKGDQAKRFSPTSAPTVKGSLRKAYLEAFEKDARDVAAGLYPAVEDSLVRPSAALREAADFIADAFEVDQRRRRGDGVEVRDEANNQAYPSYYRQNFHFQSGGWFTPESARRYDAQVEALFSGTAGAMRRRGLSLLARHWRGRDQRDARILDVACGSGAFLRDLRTAFPRAAIAGLDLSEPYLARAHRRAGVGGVKANAEALPFADSSLDAVTCVYLFHELPPRVRPVVAASLARVVKPGGVLVLVDSIQPTDAPDLARLLEAFPVYFHEPYYGSYAETDLPALFAAAGLRVIGEDRAFLTKALLLEKPVG